MLRIDHIAEDHRSLKREVDELVVVAEHEVSMDRVLAGRMAERLERLIHRLSQHFEIEEQGGYLFEVVERRPGLGSRVQVLFEEHTVILSSAHQLSREVLGEPAPHDVGQRIIAFIETLRRHELAEHDLIQQAFNEDLGSGD